VETKFAGEALEFGPVRETRVTRLVDPSFKIYIYSRPKNSFFFSVIQIHVSQSMCTDIIVPFHLEKRVLVHHHEKKTPDLGRNPVIVMLCHVNVMGHLISFLLSYSLWGV